MKDKSKGREIQAYRNRARAWGKTRKQTRTAERRAAIKEGALDMPELFQITVTRQDGTVVDSGWVALEVPNMPGGGPKLEGSMLYDEVLQYGLDNGIDDTPEEASS